LFFSHHRFGFCFGFLVLTYFVQILGSIQAIQEEDTI